jgi:hypothetical protein
MTCSRSACSLSWNQRDARHALGGWSLDYTIHLRRVYFAMICVGRPIYQNETAMRCALASAATPSTACGTCALAKSTRRSGVGAIRTVSDESCGNKAKCPPHADVSADDG